MSIVRTSIGTLIVSLLASLPLVHGAFAQDDDGAIHVEIKIVSNNNRTFILNVPPMTEVNCSGGPVTLAFDLIGSPRARFPEDAGIAIKIIDGTGAFEAPQLAGDRRVVVTDLCTQLGDYKYDVGVIDPNGNLIILDPYIKNY